MRPPVSFQNDDRDDGREQNRCRTAPSRFNLYTASYGLGAATGAAFNTNLSKPGHANLNVLKLSKNAWNGFDRQMVTNTVKIANGDHALITWPVVYCLAAEPISLGWRMPSKVKISSGCHFFQEQRQTDQADQGRGHVRQFRPDEVGGQKLSNRKRHARDQNRRPCLANAAHTIHHRNQPKRHDHRQNRQLATGQLTDVVRVEADT